VEEPGLGEQQRDRGQRDRNGPARGHDQRDEPLEVLRREDLGEREKAGDRCRERDRQPISPVARPRVEHPDRCDSRSLQHERRHRNGVRKGATQIAACDVKGLDHVRVVEPELVAGEENRGA